jgi:ubiquinone/menaquinone biosynthesis C-methylase UbiE
MFKLDAWQLTMLTILFLLLINYLMVKFLISTHLITEINDSSEAFESREGFTGNINTDDQVEEFTNSNLYDSFYSKIYDTIVQGEVRIDSEVNYTLGWMKKIQPDVSALHVLDIGCGTGSHVDAFIKAGCSNVKGVDRSEDMILRARKLYPDNTYIVGEVDTPTLFSASQFNLITMYYFTIYYMPDKAQILRNLFTWMSPGGGLVVHMVNRDKFDPILESASPFTAFSLQKYSKKRIRTSNVTFDKFEYTAEFSNDEHHAQLDETFKFKDGKIRRNLHKLHMPVMEKLVTEFEEAGFIYKEFIDLMPIGYEYQYLFCFVR